MKTSLSQETSTVVGAALWYDMTKRPRPGVARQLSMNRLFLTPVGPIPAEIDVGSCIGVVFIKDLTGARISAWGRVVHIGVHEEIGSMGLELELTAITRQAKPRRARPVPVRAIAS